MEQQINPVVWFEIYVKDMQRAINFYESVLQVKLTKLDVPQEANIDMYSFPSTGTDSGFGSSGALVKMEGMEVGGMGTVVYFGCEDCAVEESRVQNAGGSVHQSKMSIGEYGHVSICVDTEGNVFGLHSMK